MPHLGRRIGEALVCGGSSLRRSAALGNSEVLGSEKTTQPIVGDKARLNGLRLRQ